VFRDDVVVEVLDVDRGDVGGRGVLGIVGTRIAMQAAVELAAVVLEDAQAPVGVVPGSGARGPRC